MERNDERVKGVGRQVKRQILYIYVCVFSVVYFLKIVRGGEDRIRFGKRKRERKQKTKIFIV